MHFHLTLAPLVYTLRMQEFSPHLEVLPAAQRQLWVELSAVPDEFTLYGGTALALHLGHRYSVDFNFFGSRVLDLETLENEIPFLAGAQIIQREKNTLSAIVDRGAPVKVSFFGVPKLLRLAQSLIDMDALMHLGRIGLPLALAAAAMLYGSSFNPEITLKALSYFGDGNLRDLPEEMKLRLAAAVQEVDLDHLPTIDGSTLRMDRDHRHGL